MKRISVGLLCLLGTAVTASAQNVRTGTLIRSGDADTLAVTAEPGRVYLFRLHSPAGADFDLYLYDAAVLKLLGSSMRAGPVDPILFAARTDSAYRLVVRSESGAGPYRLDIARVDSVQDFLTEGASTNFHWRLRKDESCYLVLSFPPRNEFNLYVYGPLCYKIGEDIGPAPKVKEFNIERAPVDGEYTVRILAKKGSGKFALYVFSGILK